MAPLNTVGFYIRRGKLVPVGKAVSNTAEMDLLDVELLGSGTSYEQYVDDGSAKDCSLDRCVVRRP